MSIIICSIFIDYVICYLPSYHGHNVVIAILSGICAGIGYSILFNNNSSTGGTDFIIVALKKWKKNLSFGLIAFLIDGIIIVLSVFSFKKFEAFLYGLLYTITTSIFIDLMSGIIKEVKNKKI